KADQGKYDAAAGHWGYAGAPSESHDAGSGQAKDGAGRAGGGDHGVHGPGLMGGSTHQGAPRSAETAAPQGDPSRDPTLPHPRCVMQLLRRHFARYTPEMVAEVCGCTPEELIQVAETLCANSGRERTSAFVYAVGWTQHTTGVQIIRAAGI